MQDKGLLKELASNQDRIAKAICIAAAGAFLAIFLGILSSFAGNSAVVSYLIACVVGVLTFAFIGASLHMSLIESKLREQELKEFKTELSRRMESVEKLIHLGNQALESMNVNSRLITDIENQGSLRSTNMLTRVIQALNKRLSLYLELMEEGSVDSLEQAMDLIDSPLEFDSSKLTSLSGEQIPLLEREHWESTVHTLISQLGATSDGQKAA